jgi:hypothetical protein
MPDQYKDTQPLDRDALISRLRSKDDADVCHALVAAALHDPDWRWVQAQCVALAEHPSSQVRYLVAVCFGHLARIHRQIDRERVDAVLEKLALDPIPEVRHGVECARDDFAIFLDRNPIA